MADPREVVLQQLKTGQMLMEKLTADLTDAEYFVPAVGGTNHVGWILGHLGQTEDWMIYMMTGAPRNVSEDHQKLFGGASECIADAAVYPSRKTLDEMFRDNRARAREALQNFDISHWDDPAPEGDLPKEFFPNLGSIWGMMGAHQFWHIGQITTCRKAMNKKRVLG